MAGILDTDAERPYDETRTHGAAYRSVLRQLDDDGVETAAEQVQEAVDARGCSFGDQASFVVDPVPRVLDGEEWDAVARGLVQRVAALERFVADVYADQEIVAAGLVPARVIESAEHHDPRLRGLAVRQWIGVAGLDLVRGADGRFAVLEDNVRTPSGLAYLHAARQAVTATVDVPGGLQLRSIAGIAAALRRALLTAAPLGIEEPRIVVLSDGAGAAWEHEVLATGLGVPLAAPRELRSAGGRLWLERDGERRPVDVVYRRTNEERLFTPDGAPTALGDLLLDPLRAGRLAVTNAFGAGVADDKLVHAYVEEMVRFYLGEEPLLPSVPTYDLSDPGVLSRVLDRLGELVVKPRTGHGGRGVVIGPLAAADELALLRRMVTADPGSYIAQETVLLSEHPTVAGDELEPRHVDLRPFVLSAGDRRHVVPGGLTRVALEEGQMIVNSSRSGGAKDTWVLD